MHPVAAHNLLTPVAVKAPRRLRVSRTRRARMGVRIVVGEREPIGSALRRFKKAVERSGIWWEMRRRRSFGSATQARRAKQFKKRWKARRSTLLAQKRGEQPAEWTDEAKAAFYRKSGKP